MWNRGISYKNRRSDLVNVRNVVTTAVGGIASRGALFIVNALAVKFLATDEYGFVSYLLTVISSLAIFSSFGSSTVVNTSLARYGATTAATVVSGCALLITAVSFLAAAAFLPLFFSAPQQPLSWPLQLAATLLVWLLSFSVLCEGAFNGLGAYRSLALSSILSLSLSLPVIVISIWRWNVAGVIAALIFYRTVSVALHVILLRRSGLFTHAASPKDLANAQFAAILAKVGLPALLSSLMVAPAMAVAMQMLANEPDGLRTVGFFAWPYQVYNVATLIPNLLNGYYLSKLSRNDARKISLAAPILTNISLATATTFILWALADPILAFAGADYIYSARRIYNAMLVVVLLYALNSAFSSYWPAAGLNWVGFALNVAWACIFLTATWVLLKNNQEMAIPFALSIAYAGLLAIQISLLFVRMLQRPHAIVSNPRNPSVNG